MLQYLFFLKEFYLNLVHYLQIGHSCSCGFNILNLEYTCAFQSNVIIQNNIICILNNGFS